MLGHMWTRIEWFPNKYLTRAPRIWVFQNPPFLGIFWFPEIRVKDNLFWGVLVGMDCLWWREALFKISVQSNSFWWVLHFSESLRVPTLLFLKRWFSEIATGLQYLGFCSLCLQRFSSSKHLLIQFSVSNLADLFRLPQVCALQQQLVSISSVSDKQHSSRWMASCSTATAAQFSFRFALLVRLRATSKLVSSLALLCSSSSLSRLHASCSFSGQIASVLLQDMNVLASYEL